jgi:hypothetical protein
MRPCLAVLFLVGRRSPLAPAIARPPQAQRSAAQHSGSAVAFDFEKPAAQISQEKASS